MSGAAHLPPAYPDRAAWGTAPKLRAWQADALTAYHGENPRDFLAVATPGAGKTTFALSLAGRLLEARVVERVVVVAPTDHLKTQWAEAGARAGIPLDPTVTGRGGALAKDFRGFALTYAGVATNPTAYRLRTERFRTLVILDEVHHAGDALSWGDAVREAFEPATRRVALTGTPFRSDTFPIPFVSYAPGTDGIVRSVADYSYGYAEALADGVVRPVLFMAYTGDMRWRTRAGDEVAARLGEPMTKDVTAHALRTALDPGGSWIPSVLAAADRRLSEVRRHVPDAGGLVIATDQESARAYAKILRELTGTGPALVLSDEKESSKRISDFAQSEDRWMVAVRMVSEGVDVPRLAVGVYATTTSTPLFFAQAVGRFVRARRRGETATVFVPSVPRLLGLASELEVERDHVLGRPGGDDDDPNALDDELIAAAQATESVAGLEEFDFAALDSEASFDRVLYDGGEFGHEGEVAVGSDEEMDFLGIPGLLEPDQVRELLRHARSRRAGTAGGAPAGGPGSAAPAAGGAGAGSGEAAAAPDEPSAHQRRALLRRELNSLVGAWHHRTGEPHGVTHNRLRETCGGPPAASASTDDLTKRIDTLRGWASRPS